MPKITSKCVIMLRKYQGKINLDAGCGQGSYLSLFDKFVVGLDVSKVELVKSKKTIRPNVEYVIGSIRSLPFRDYVFNYSQCLEAIEHLCDEDATHALHELERVTDGSIQVSTPNVNIVQECIREILFPRSFFDKNPMAHMAVSSPHRHRSLWTVKKLGINGFKVNGCLGWVTQQRIGSKKICSLYDFFFWYLPSLAGTLIGLRFVSNSKTEVYNKCEQK